METTNNMAVGETTNTEAVSTESKTYTQAEVDALLQSETDRRVTSALKKQEAKMADRINEAQKIAQMNEKDKYEYRLAQREKAIKEKEDLLALAEMKSETAKILAEKGISISLVDMVVNLDADITNDNIKMLEKAFKESVKAEVEKRLSSKVPMKSLPTADQGITKEQFRKMSLADLQRLKSEQPDLWQEMTK